MTDPSSAIVLTLPEPPSANRYWRNVKGRTLLSRAAREYKAACAVVISAAHVHALVGPIAVSLDWYRGRKSGDLDNRIKQALDALQGCLYADDAHIVELHAYRFEDKANPRIVVTARVRG